MLGDLIKGGEFTYQILLCKPVAPYQIIACLTECAYDVNIKRQLMNIDDLSFTLPYYWNDTKSSKNENFNLVNTGAVIKFQSYIDDELKEEQYFYVYETNRLGGDKETKHVNCYSLEYKLNKVRIRKFSTNVTSSGSTGDFVTTRMIYNNQTFDPTDKTKGGMVDYIIQTKLQNTWSVSHMSASLAGLYRTFDVSDKTVMEVFHEIEQNFNCIFFFDTINHTIQIRDYDDLPSETGLILHDSNYIKQIQEKIKIDEVVTRLYVLGDKDATMSRANPTGQDYVDDFTFFKKPEYMSQSLITALTAYEIKLLAYAENFSELQDQLLAKQNSLEDLYQDPSTGYYKLETDLLNVQSNEDGIIRMKSPSNPSPVLNGHDYNYWFGKEGIAKTALASKQAEINSKQAEIDNLNDVTIPALCYELAYENPVNFSSTLLQELFGFVNEDNSKCNTEDPKELYTFGKAVLAIKAQPPIECELGIIDILNCAEENYTWDKFTLGSKVDLIFEDFNIQTKPRITAYTHDVDKNSLSVTVSNKTYFNDDLNYITAIFAKSKQTANTLDAEKDIYKDYQNDKGAINDYINSPIDVTSQPIELDYATVVLERRGMFARSIDGSGGTMRIMDNKIVMSKDNFATYSTAITGDGIYCDHLWALTNSGKSVEINDLGITCSDMRLDMTTFNNKNRIVIDPNNGKGIFIQKLVNGTPTNVFSVDGNGNLIVNGNITMGAGSYIDWSLVNTDPVASTATTTANSALTKALAIANGTYAGGTFITGTTIYSPTIMNNKAGLTDNGTTDTDIRFWAGDSFTNRAIAPFRVTQGGAVTCSNLILTGGSITWSSFAGTPIPDANLSSSSKWNGRTTQILDTGIYTGNLTAGQVSTGTLSTSGWDGSGTNYIMMSRQMMYFKEGALTKMALGFLPNKDNLQVPIMVLGAGDGYGNNRGYIEKDASGMNMYYISGSGTASYISLQDGVANINGKQIFTKDATAPLSDTYIAKASTWNAKLSEAEAKIVLEDSGRGWNIPKENLNDTVVANWDGKETTTGSQAKADSAYNSATSYAGGLDTTLRSNLRLSTALPTTITQDNNGITATITGQPTKWARLGGNGLEINNGAILIRNSSGTTIIDGNGIVTSGLGAEKIYKPGSPNNYAVIGGTYGDLVLNYNSAEFFRIENLYGGIGFKHSSVEKFSIGDSGFIFGTSGNHITVDFSYATVTGFQVKFA